MLIYIKIFCWWFFVLQVLSYFAKKEQSLYATSGAIASEVLSAVRTVVAYGGEFKEHERSVKYSFALPDFQLHCTT